MKRISAIFSATALTLAISCFADTATNANDEETDIKNAYIIISDVEYLGPDRPEKMDIYMPLTSSKVRPAILYIHGGGWAKGDKKDQIAISVCTFLAQQGYAAFSIDYKLTEYEGRAWNSRMMKGGWPQHIYDCKTAVRYIRKNAENYHVDPNKIAVIGSSAGGHLALLTALSSNHTELDQGGLYTDVPCNIACVVDMYGIPDVRVWGGSAFIDVDKSQKPEVWALASPITHLSGSAPPMLVIHGDRDEVVDVQQSIDFVNTLKEMKLEHQFVIVKGGGHGFDLQPPQMDLRPIVLDFFEKYLK